MKIFCIGRNYADHAKELDNPIPKEPVIFLKPSTAVYNVRSNLYYPEFTDDLHYECEVVFRICKNGKNIQEKFARQYFDAWTVGVDLTARDMQNKLKKQGLPWEISKAFDNSCIVGEWRTITDYGQIRNADFSLAVNGIVVQKDNTANMIFSIEKIISYLSRYFTLQIGDCIFTGTPSGVDALLPYDRMTGTLNGEQLFDVEMK